MSGPRYTLSDLSPAHQREVLRQLERNKPVGMARAETIKLGRVDKPRLRQSSQKLNKTEAAFALWLKEHEQATAHEQAITLKLGNGVRYTPDFVTAGAALTAWEVKGHMRDDAAVKLKVAAAQYPWIKFRLVTKGAGGSWRIEDVLP